MIVETEYTTFETDQIEFSAVNSTAIFKDPRYGYQEISIEKIISIQS